MIHVGRIRNRSTITGRMLLICGLVALAILGGCLPHTEKESPRPGRIRIATDALFPPFHFVAGDGNTTGYDIELIHAVLLHAGYEPDVVVVRPYQALFDGLDNGHHEVIAATTGITPQRQSRYRFSDPYFQTCQAIVIRRGPGEPVSRGDLAGRRVGAAGSGTSARALRQMEDVKPVPLEKGSEAVQALLDRDIDAYIVDEFEAVGAARLHPQQLQVLPQPAALEEYGFVTARDRPDLQRRINRSLRALTRNGTVDQLRRQFNINRDPDWPVQLP